MSKMSVDQAINLWWISCPKDEEGLIKLKMLIDEFMSIAEARIKELEQQLREYGDHSAGCSGGYIPFKCKCGWDKVFDALSKSEEVINE